MTATEVILNALREYLALRGYGGPPPRSFTLTPASHGSGRDDVSMEHDRFIAEGRLPR